MSDTIPDNQDAGARTGTLADLKDFAASGALPPPGAASAGGRSATRRRRPTRWRGTGGARCS